MGRQSLLGAHHAGYHPGRPRGSGGALAGDAGGEVRAVSADCVSATAVSRPVPRRRRRDGQALLQRDARVWAFSLLPLLFLRASSILLHQLLMARMGHRDPLVGSVMLAYCRDKKLYELADSVFQRITELNILKKNYKDDVQVFEVEGLKYNHNPPAASAQVIYEIMADITARQVGLFNPSALKFKWALLIVRFWWKELRPILNKQRFFTTLMSKPRTMMLTCLIRRHSSKSFTCISMPSSLELD